MKIFSAITSLAALFLLAGCAEFPPDLEEAGMVKVIAKQGDDLPRVSITTVYNTAQETVIRGKLTRPSFYWFEMFNGHIDVTVASPGDAKFTIHDAATIRIGHLKNRGRYAYFVAHLGTEVKKGTVLTVAYSREQHQGHT